MGWAEQPRDDTGHSAGAVECGSDRVTRGVFMLWGIGIVECSQNVELSRYFIEGGSARPAPPGAVLMGLAAQVSRRELAHR